MQGKFIVIEGGEGAGKSSTVWWLKSELSEQEFVFTREPGGVENAEEIREVILKKRHEPLDVFSHMMLFEAARREHVMKKIIPTLEAGTHVICDRFSASTYAYQIVAGENHEYAELFEAVDSAARNAVEPDLTIYLDVEPTVGLSRKDKSGDELNVFDEKDITFHTAVRSGMKDYIQKRPHILIDANKTPEEVREAVKDAIVKCIQS